MPSLAQQKYEREYTIKPSAVPEKASKFIRDVFKGAKIHWYGEESLKQKTIEAKFKVAGKRYSIEFDPSGEVQDVEIRSSFNAIPSETRAVLTKRLNREFDKFKVVKTQIQWKADKSILQQALVAETAPKSVQVRYELILKASKKRITNYYEVLCEKSGEVVSIHEIIQRNTDNLIY
ncbi:hypothetical protein [Larkinella arboricola]|uniref:Uncharacterized protein n=2 Tax=Larkinella arboricola TaxID=643671 RepID=A0A327WVG2_LARAB|nr:hypothetical protein LX87_04612 [Larkinella arboricola]